MNLFSKIMVTSRITLSPDVTLEFVRVPAGQFLMGHKENPPHRKVWLDEYLIGKYPVTNAQYHAFVQSTGAQKPANWFGGEIPEGKEDHPVVYVSWNDASAFCAWAGSVSGRPVRLPTDAEWEKAARGTDGRTYPWGEGINRTKTNFKNNIADTSTVGAYPHGASPCGALDMAGNVWEWVNDWHAGIDFKPLTDRNPTGPETGVEKTLRGGAWNGNEDTLRTHDRDGDFPTQVHLRHGFRCACSVR